MKKVCLYCRFWSREEKKDYREDWSGDCSNDKFVYEVGLPRDGLLYWDYEGYSAGIVTGEMFGCIHWEGR